MYLVWTSAQFVRCRKYSEQSPK